MVTGFVILSSVYLFFPQFHREDWKSLALSLPKNATVYIIESSADALKYYRPDLIIKNLTSSDFMNDRTKNQNLTLIIIPYTTEIYGYGYKDKLKQSNFSNIKTYSFRQLTYEIWRGEGNF